MFCGFLKQKDVTRNYIESLCARDAYTFDIIKKDTRTVRSNSEEQKKWEIFCVPFGRPHYYTSFCVSLWSISMRTRPGKSFQFLDSPRLVLVIGDVLFVIEYLLISNRICCCETSKMFPWRINIRIRRSESPVTVQLRTQGTQKSFSWNK